MISNTAVPKYYEEFRDAVVCGEIPVNREIEMEMNRIDGLVADRRYYYDPAPVEGWISYCENELTLTDGQDLKLLPSFKVWGEQVLGWYEFIEEPAYIPATPLKKGGWVTVVKKQRLTKKQYLIVARGAAKSMYASCLQSYFLNCDKDTTQQITTAPTMKQADEVMSPIRTAILRSRGPLFQFLTEGSLQNTTGSRFNRQQLASTKKGIENFFTGSQLEVRPMSIDKLQGLRPKYSTIDEWLSGDIREDVIGAIEQGASKHDDYVIIAISSEGTVRNGPGDTVKMELAGYLKGDTSAPHISIWHYKLDEIEEVGMPEMWPKANPNLGLTVKYNVYTRDVVRMEQNPATRNEILAKRFGLPRTGLSYFFTHDEIQLHPFKRYWQVPCAMGADLSQGDDFCAFTFLFPLSRERFGIKTRCYITQHTLDKLPGAPRAKYQEFIDEGSLYVMPGVVLDIEGAVYEDLQEYRDSNKYEVAAFGYDPYNAKEFVERWIVDEGDFTIEKVIQGAKTESVPLGEIKKYMGERLFQFDQELMKWAMGNAQAVEDSNGNIKLSKRKQEEKIDAVSALMDAYVVYKKFKEAFE